MNRIIALLLVFVICLSVCSCGLLVNLHAVALADEKTDASEFKWHETDEYVSFLAKLEAFSAKLTAEFNERYGATDNFVISPISVYMTLALAIECSDGETRDEMLQAVGVTYEEVNEYTKYLYSDCNRESEYKASITNKKSFLEMLNNSIWLDDDTVFNNEGVNKLASNYNCDVFKVEFESGQAKRLIGQYIESKTRGLIDGKVDFSPETVMVLMNTFYLKEIWKRLGKELNFTNESYDFKNTDGSVTQTKLLKGEYVEGKAYDGEGFTSFFSRTYNSFRLYFFVPDEDSSVADIFTEENISTVLSINDWQGYDEENNEIHGTRVLFPKFEATFNQDITDSLREDFGITRFFDKNLCDASNIGENLYCEKVIHKCTLKVDETGLEGAAMVEIQFGATSAAPITYVYHDLIVDKAFGFVLTDHYGTVLFSGVINSINK